MMQSKTICIYFFLMLSFSFSVIATTPWTDVSENELSNTHPAPLWKAKKYRTLSLDWQQLWDIIGEAPMRFSNEAATTQVILPIPMPDGSTQHFDITEVKVMHEELAAKFPMIKTYAGVGIENPAATIRFDIGTFGFHAMVLYPGQNSLFINPYSRNNQDDYISFYKRDFIKPKNAPTFECRLDESNPLAEPLPNLQSAGDCQFRSYELALACTVEYAAFHGGTVNSVMSAMVTTMNRVNGIFERDSGHTMVLVPENDQLIFINSDNFTNSDGGAMLGQNQTVCDNIIGSNNYDIGHVFSTGGGGIAQLRCPCGSSKAQGVTGQGSPVGDPFDVDYVAHEMGHQYGANHTQNNNCNRNGSTAMEPGSASTIMGYAGICAPNVQNNSDDYFHGISLLEMGNFTSSNAGSCGEIINTNNNMPVTDAGANYSIPVSTPFTLTGSATDADGDPLTYCWEQMDNENGNMPPTASNTQGPAFRSFSPLTVPSRTFPDMNAVINNTTPTWEVLPAVGRTMNFMLTVRDNNSTYGCTSDDATTITTIDGIGPFLLLSPNVAGIVWSVGAQETVTWDVAGTDGGEVSCANVDILLSNDGGLTYPTTLATGVPNTGAATITVPNVETNNARVLIVCSDNIFFDISNQNFTIEISFPDFTLNPEQATLSACAPDDAVFDIFVGSLSSFSDPVDLVANNIPDGVTATFSSSTVDPATNVTLTITNTAALANGSYDIDVVATSTTGTKTTTLTLNFAQTAPTAPVINVPADGATDVSAIQTLGWQNIPGASSYTIEIATDPMFNNIIATENTTISNYTPANPFDSATTYYWRILASNLCGTGSMTTASFTTAELQCGLNFSNNQSVTISAAGSNTYTSTISVLVPGIIADVNVSNLDVLHTYTGDLTFTLTSPSGTVITLFDQPGVPSSTYGCSQDNLLLSFDDDAANSATTLENTCNTGTTQAISGAYQAITPLSDLNGEELAGQWTLTFTDNVGEDGGELVSWALEFCTSIPAALPLDWLSFKAIALDKEIELLWSTANEQNNLGFEVYRTADPDKGFELIGWVDANRTATQHYKYMDKTAEPGTVYYYKLQQKDSDGRFSESRIVSASLKASGNQQLSLFPNPAQETVSVSIGSERDDTVEVNIFDINGKKISSILRDKDAPAQFSIDISGYPTGIYFVHLVSDGFVVTEKLVVD